MQTPPRWFPISLPSQQPDGAFSKAKHPQQLSMNSEQKSFRGSEVTSKDLDLPPALTDLLQPHWPPWGFHHLPSRMGFRVFDLALPPCGIPFPREPWLAPSLPSGFCLDITFSERPSWRKDNFLFLPSCFMFFHNSGHYLFV